ncbi:hypothetical protein D3C86_2192440 [compost metagenome]
MHLFKPANLTKAPAVKFGAVGQNYQCLRSINHFLIEGGLSNIGNGKAKIKVYPIYT